MLHICTFLQLILSPDLLVLTTKVGKVRPTVHSLVIYFSLPLFFQCLLVSSLSILQTVSMITDWGIRLDKLLHRRRRRCQSRRRRSRRRGGAGGSEEAELDPVLLVSGMGGSVLHAKKKSDSKFELRVWVRILFADLEFKKYIWSLYNPDSGYVESLDSDVEIEVPDDDYGLYALDILDPSWFVKLFKVTDVYHFHEMIDMLVNCGYEKGKTLFGFGYDFRQSNRIDQAMDGLKTKLKTAYKASGGKKVNLISHSMGGLLVKCFLSLYSDEFEKYVNKWICIACPFQGAPGCINDSLLTGLQFVYGFESFFFVSRWTMHQLLVECPSVYEMLPNPNFKWKQKPVINVWQKNSESNEVELLNYDATNCVSLFEQALRNNELEYNGKTVALPFNKSILRWATKTREIIENAKLPSNISFYNVYGTELDTPFDVSYGSESSPIGDLSEVCETMPQYSYVGGDGTVPSESAMADGFDAISRVGIKTCDHRGLLCDERVLDLIKKWLGVTENSSSVSSSKVMNI
ncbi:hypothetical protein LUZ60_015634 [Juncus effusus]|nr:hypothetical protein LUZ60_015634 [Juncus effusus]